MKCLALTIAMAVATPAFAQQQPPQQPMPTQQPMPAAQTDATAPDPAGYQPSTAPLSGPPAPGTMPVFQQAPAPDQAYPAPAPLAHYPICKRGQYDNCMQRGG